MVRELTFASNQFTSQLVNRRPLEVSQTPCREELFLIMTASRRFHRAMTRPFFTKDRISHFELFDRHAEDAIKQMKERFAEGCPVDFQVSSLFDLLPHLAEYCIRRTSSPVSHWTLRQSSCWDATSGRYRRACRTPTTMAKENSLSIET